MHFGVAATPRYLKSLLKCTRRGKVWGGSADAECIEDRRRQGVFDILKLEAALTGVGRKSGGNNRVALAGALPCRLERAE